MIVIGLAGKAGSGKDLFARYLEESIDHKDVYIKSIAKPIKSMSWILISHLFPNALLHNPRAMEDPISKNKPLRHKFYSKYNLPPRFYMQEIGSALRKAIDKDLWIDILISQIMLLGNELMMNSSPDVFRNAVVIVIDVRRDSEITRLRSHFPDKSFFCVGLSRKDAPEVRDHETERGVSGDLMDLHIANDGTMNDLKLNAQNVVKHLLGEDNVRRD